MSTTNGISQNEDKFDPNSDNLNQIVKPPNIEQDLKEMERRKRVEMMINSQIFREELERIIESQFNEGYLPASLSALQQVTELLPHSARNSPLSRFGHSAIPINDIRGIDAFNYAKGEKLLRCKLAAVYRLVDLYGWSQSIYNHISVRVSQDQEHFLLNPFGLQYHEITASSLLKVDMQGNVLNPGSTNFGFNRAGFVLHSAIHSARPDLKAVIHIHHRSCVAVSSMKCGLLKICQEAAILGDVSYHDFRGILVDSEERELIIRNLGPVNKVLILKNHGVVTCGETIEEALFLMHHLVLACEAQVKLANIGLDNIYQMSSEAVEQVRSIVKTGGAQTQGKLEEEKDKSNEDESKEKLKKWKIWDLEFEAQMRMLDNAGFRTGYLYRQPLLRVDQSKPKYDVEIPPSATSLNQFIESDKWLSPLKKLVDGKKTQDKLRWVNSPNSYQKVEISETGTTDPKKITKWVSDSSPSHSNSVKIDNPHQFVPVTADVNEFRRKQKELKQVRMENKISGGPQSHILEGVTWEEVKKEQDDSDQVIFLGAASKGIIQRQFQHNATVYKSAYAKNPFHNISDQDIEEYKTIVEKKQRGEPVDDDVPENVRHLLLEPVAEQIDEEQIASPVEQLSKSPQSPLSEEASKTSNNRVHRSHSARLAAQAAEDNYFARRHKSERKPKHCTSDTAVNGEEKIGDLSGASRSSKESSPVKDISDDKSSKKDKKKKGIRTPSFLKKKKHKKEKKEESHA